MLRQSDAQVFEKYSQMKLQMKREALNKINRQANEAAPMDAIDPLAIPLCTVAVNNTIRAQSEPRLRSWSKDGPAKSLAIGEKVGEPGRTRTYNPLLKRQLLYH
jgi:hypothetical protein